MNWRPGDKNDPENCPVCGGNPSNCDHPTVRPRPVACLALLAVLTVAACGGGSGENAPNVAADFQSYIESNQDYLVNVSPDTTVKGCSKTDRKHLDLPVYACEVDDPEDFMRISVCVIDNSGDIREVEGAPFITCERSLEEADKEAQQNAGKPFIVNQSASDVSDDVAYDFVASLKERGDVAAFERGVIVKCAGRGGDMYVCYSDHSLVNTCFNWYGPGQGISEIAYVHFDPQYRFSGVAGDPDQWTAAGCGDFDP